mgnify:CR=1 FL=1
MSHQRIARAGKRKKQRIFLLIAVLLVFLIGMGACLAPKIIREIETNLYPLEYTEYVDKYSEEFGVDKAVIYAVIKTESGFRPDVTSSAGARGLMQMIEDAFHWSQQRYGTKEPVDFDKAFDPETNIKYGTYILKLLYDEFGENDLVFAAYHAGRSNVIAWLENPQYSKDGVLTDIPSDTRHYINKVNQALIMYHKLYDL